MLALQSICLAIVVFYVVVRLRRAMDDRARQEFVLRFITLSAAAWVGEDSIIRAYGTYAYATKWNLILDRVPLVIILVWPVVIDSAATLARALCRAETKAKIALVTAAIVFADASLIEPISVRCGLWAWTDPGVFSVPLVGIAGWAIFAGLATYLFERHPEANLVTIVVAPLLTHLVILATWWMLFRWIQGAIAPRILITAVMLSNLALAIVAWRVGWRLRFSDIMLRAPGALFFFGLLAFDPAARDLVSYALPFALPYTAALMAVYLHARQAGKARKIGTNAPARKTLESL